MSGINIVQWDSLTLEEFLAEPGFYIGKVSMGAAFLITAGDQKTPIVTIIPAASELASVLPAPDQTSSGE